SDFGVAIVERMNKVGMAVDVSHCGDTTSLDASQASKKPVLITHANCRALNPNHPRCKTDEAIKAMAAKGGVMGITEVRMFVSPTEPTGLDAMLDHYDHVRKLVGVEHVGVGSDIDLLGYDAMPPDEYKQLKAGYKSSYGFRDKIDIDGYTFAKRPFDLAEGLIRRKYGDADVVPLKTGQDADLGGVTDTGGDFAGQNGGHQFVASGLVEDKRCPGNKLAASRQQNNVLEKLQRPRAAAILVVDFAVHVIGIGQVNQPGARFEVAVVPASKPQATGSTRF